MIVAELQKASYEKSENDITFSFEKLVENGLD